MSMCGKPCIVKIYRKREMNLVLLWQVVNKKGVHLQGNM